MQMSALTVPATTRGSALQAATRSWKPSPCSVVAVADSAVAGSLTAQAEPASNPAVKTTPWRNSIRIPPTHLGTAAEYRTGTHAESNQYNLRSRSQQGQSLLLIRKSVVTRAIETTNRPGPRRGCSGRRVRRGLLAPPEA